MGVMRHLSLVIRALPIAGRPSSPMTNDPCPMTMPSFMNGPLLRLLDANANRAREALRVLEDYARFVLNDQALSASLKSLRHALTEAMADHLPDAILHRDTPGDVGTANKTATEQKR